MPRNYAVSQNYLEELLSNFFTVDPRIEDRWIEDESHHFFKIFLVHLLLIALGKSFLKLLECLCFEFGERTIQALEIKHVLSRKVNALQNINHLQR